MAEIKLSKIDPRCAHCGELVTVVVPANEFGNAHGERWLCEHAKLSCRAEENIVYRR